MRKFRMISILFLILLTFNAKALSCDKTYLIQTVNSDGMNEYIDCVDNYDDAVRIMREYPSTNIKDAAIFKSGTLINARYAVLNLTDKGTTTLMYQNKNLSGTYYTYFAGNWGADGAFIDYNPLKPSIKLKLSGAIGWIAASKADIIPLSSLYGSTVTAKRSIRVRSTPKVESDNSNQISTIQSGSSWKFAEKVEADGYLWYKINFNGSYAYIAGKNLKNGETYATDSTTYSFDTYYYVSQSKNLMHYYRTKSAKYTISLGPAPTTMQAGVKYYSFDGNYFYTEIETMLDDYYNETFEHAFNADAPFYSYFMYLPTHNKSMYTADDLNQIISNAGYTCAPDPNVTYYTLEGGWNKNVSRTGVSALYGAGDTFIRVQEEYGVNALLMFATAINESGWGASALALFKNNLFGQGAVDTNPIEAANTYDTIYDSVVGHALLTGVSYSLPTGKYFHGAFYGNKGSGFGVDYASDPYWGEKTARNSYNYDKQYGGQDYYAYTLGIKQTSEAIPIKKRPSDSSATIYLTKNNKYNHLVANMSYIVTEKVYDENGTAWYKIYTDTSLDENQNVSSSRYYNFDYSYGYIKAEYLYLINKEPVIEAESYSISRGEEINLMNNVTAIDPEDGNITDKITYTGEVDANTVGDYKITYTVVDSSKMTIHKEIVVTVLPSEAPNIVASDVEIKQYKTFNPLDYVKVYDIYGNLINNFEVTNNTVNVNVVGEYEVTYKATYQSFNITKTIKVKVIKDEIPTLNVNSRTIKLNEEFNYMAGVSANDVEDGDLTELVTYEGVVDVTNIGEYEVTYTVKDSANQSVSKKITIKVEEIEYIKKDGDFYFNELRFENSRLNISGYLAIKGTNNRESDVITYDLILRNNETSYDIIIPLERFLEGRPERHYKDSKYDYSATWFKGVISLDGLSQGEYTLYVRARKDDLEAISLFRNLFAKEMTNKGESNGKGFLFRNNNYLDEYPIELFVFENGLISNGSSPNMINMINNYKTLELNEGELSIKGTSYNIGVSYAANTNVTRNIIFENAKTYERYTFDVGSIVGLDIPLNVSDGFTRERGWFNNTIDISSLPVGDYVIYVQTKVGNVNDFGELNDIFMKDLTNVNSTFDGKRVTFTINTMKRFRIEMHIEAV